MLHLTASCSYATFNGGAFIYHMNSTFIYHMKSPWTDFWTIFGFELQTRLKLLTAVTAQLLLLPVGGGLVCIWKGRKSAGWPRVLHVIALACSREVHIRKDRNYSGRSVRLELCCFILHQRGGQGYSMSSRWHARGRQIFAQTEITLGGLSA